MGPRSFLTAALCASLFFGSAAFAAPGLYLAGALGLTFVSEGDFEGGGLSAEAEFDTGFVVQGAFGHAYPMGLRAEVELAYRANGFDKIKVSNRSHSASGDISAVSLMLNGYYDFHLGTSVTPFLGGGIGYASITVDNLKAGGIELADDDDNVFAYQLTAGVEIPVTDAASIDVTYRYFATSDPDFGGPDLEYRTHNFTAGIRVYF